MATNVGTLIVELVADITGLKGGLDKAGKEVQGFGGKTKQWFADSQIAIGAGIAGISAAIVTSIKAYGEQEQAVAKLNQALANQGIYTAQTSKAMVDYAAELQRVTTFTDESIIAVESSLTAFGLEGEQLKKATKATLDLAAAKGIDLASASQLLGKAFVGETGTLARYGIVLSDNIPKTQKFAAAMDAVNGMFGGQAETMRNTTLGAWTGFQNAINDVQEEIGAFLASDATGILSWLTGFAERVSNGLKIIREFATEMGGFGNALKSVVLEVLRIIVQALFDAITQLTILGPILKLLGVDIMAVKAGIDAQIDSWQKSNIEAGAAAAEAKKGQETVRAEIINTKKVHEEATVAAYQTTKHASDQRVQDWIAEKQMQIAWDAKLKDTLELNTGHWTDFTLKSLASVTDQMGQGVADMILESRKFSDVIKQIWKDIARAVIAEIARMIAKWLVFQALKAGATGGFGGFMAEGGIISEPSVITGLRSGVSYVAGEAGPEAVVPLSQIHSSSATNATMDDYNAENGKGGAGGTLNVTVNVSGQFIEGDENAWQRLIREKVVPEIRRFTMSNPTGMFNRRRGATA